MSEVADELRAQLHATFPDPGNRAVLQWLSQYTSAHGDLVERLVEAVRYLPVDLWSPEGDFPFVVVSTPSGVIIGAAVSMNEIYVRVPRHLEAAAAADGERVIDVGPGWYRCAAFDADVTEVELVGRLSRWFEAALGSEDP